MNETNQPTTQTPESVSPVSTIPEPVSQPEPDSPPADQQIATEAFKQLVPQELFGKVEKDITERGQLSDEVLEALKASGLPDTWIEAGVAGYKSRVDSFHSAVFDAAGGKEAYGAMIAWAANEFSETDRAAFNSAVQSGDPARARQAVSDLALRYERAEGRPAAVQITGTPEANAVRPFPDLDSYLSVLGDPRYAADPGFRAQQQRRLAVSKFQEW